MSGFLEALIGIPLPFEGILTVMLGVLYGLSPFLHPWAWTVGRLAFYLNKRVGKSLQFGDYSISLLLVAQVAALTIAAVFFIALLSLSKIPQSLFVGSVSKLNEETAYS